MNTRQRPSRLVNKESHARHRASADHDELLPWADPYIVSLFRDHERQSREEGNSRRTRA
jgi:hypothetical protein